MRVADIKCFCEGTDTGSFLKEGEYSGAISSLDALSPDLDSQTDKLKGEMSGGGLDASALNLGGFSPLFEMGYVANNNIKSANNSINEIKEIIEADANTHMVNEWGKYHQEVQKCTEKKRSARDKAKSYYDGLSNDDPNRSSAQSAYLSAEAEYQEHVKELESSGTMLDTVSHKHYDILGYDAYPAIQLTGVGTGYKSDGTPAGDVQASIYSELSALGYSRSGICAILANM